jgi:hypothetical protein
MTSVGGPTRVHHRHGRRSSGHAIDVPGPAERETREDRYPEPRACTRQPRDRSASSDSRVHGGPSESRMDRRPHGAHRGAKCRLAARPSPCSRGRAHSTGCRCVGGDGPGTHGRCARGRRDGPDSHGRFQLRSSRRRSYCQSRATGRQHHGTYIRRLSRTARQAATAPPGSRPPCHAGGLALGWPTRTVPGSLGR